jgi:biopolymer transport protein ExbD
MKIPLPTSRRKARIEIIPLIDVIFFLLATFMMISLSMIKNQGINVNLPAARTSASEDRSKSVTITVTETSDVYLDKEKINLTMLSQELKSLRAQDPELKVFINGDAKAYFENAIKVLDEIRLAGITKVAIQTKGASVIK